MAKKNTAPAANKITDTFGGSPVTSDLPNTNPAAETEIPLNQAKITVPSGVVAAPAREPEVVEEKEDNSFGARAMRASIGLITVDGAGFRYVGVAPARDKDPKTPGGTPISTDNSTFTALADVPFDVSVRVKDPKTGEFYFPTEAAGWADCEYKGNPLVPSK